MVRSRIACCLAMILLLAACSPRVPVDDALVAAPPAAARGSAGPYVLGPGDKVRVKVYDDANVTGEYEVNAAGFVSVPLVGQTRASGLTTGQLERALAAKMKSGIANDPKINVEVATYAPFYVHGEVKKAGSFPFQPGLTIADAIATAGGLTYRADENTVLVRRAGARAPVAVPLDRTAPVFPGDNIRVAERFF